jgi:hypothetical protein
MPIGSAWPGTRKAVSRRSGSVAPNRNRAASGWNDDAVMRMENAIFSSDHRRGERHLSEKTAI